MVLKDGVVLAGLSLHMRTVLIEAERIWKELGRSEGVTVTSALDGTHSAGSFHYYGRALDFRTRYFSQAQKDKAYGALCSVLDWTKFDVVMHDTHIHVEYDPKE